MLFKVIENTLGCIYTNAYRHTIHWLNTLQSKRQDDLTEFSWVNHFFFTVACDRLMILLFYMSKELSCLQLDFSCFLNSLDNMIWMNECDSSSQTSCCVLPAAPGASVWDALEHSCSGCPCPDGCQSPHQSYVGPAKNKTQTSVRKVSTLHYTTRAGNT